LLAVNCEPSFKEALFWKLTLLIIQMMKTANDLKTWLPWVIKIRFVIISFVFAIEYAVRQFVPSPNNSAGVKQLGLAVILWYILGLFFLIYNQLSQDYALQAYLQIYSDIAIITAIIHVTGDLDSNYISLYLVAIIMASILLPRARAFMVAGVSFICMGALLELVYLPSLYPGLAGRHPDLTFLADPSVRVDQGTLQVKVFASLFGFFAVTYLSSYLAESLRKTGAELRDKTGQVASLHALNENIIRSMRGGLITIDLGGSIQDLNPAGATILGLEPVEIVGKGILTILPSLQGGESSATSLAPITRREIPYRHPRKEEERILGISASPLEVPETGIMGYIYTFQDLTDEKRREAEYRAKDRMATLGRMASGIAHEIRNPLASIAGSVKLLQSIVDLNEDQAKLIDIVRRESGRLDRLVSNFLAYSREQQFEFQSVDLVNLIEETLILLQQHPMFGRGCTINRSLPAHPMMASVDADKMRQVFWNICDNALKAMPQGGTLTASIEDGTGQDIRVVFTDTGVGIASGQLDRLFEPFDSRFSNGTGLGLAIVHRIVKAHHGHVRVDSEPGKGTRLSIELPRAGTSTK